METATQRGHIHVCIAARLQGASVANRAQIKMDDHVVCGRAALKPLWLTKPASCVENCYTYHHHRKTCPAFASQGHHVRP